MYAVCARLLLSKRIRHLICMSVCQTCRKFLSYKYFGFVKDTVSSLDKAKLYIYSKCQLTDRCSWVVEWQLCRMCVCGFFFFLHYPHCVFVTRVPTFCRTAPLLLTYCSRLCLEGRLSLRCWIVKDLSL